MSGIFESDESISEFRYFRIIKFNMLIPQSRNLFQNVPENGKLLKIAYVAEKDFILRYKVMEHVEF